MNRLASLLATSLAACVTTSAAEWLGAGSHRFDSPRHFAVTREAGFAKSSFQAEVTVMLNEGSGESCTLGDGTHRLRLTWDANGKRAWFGAHPNWKPGTSFQATRSLFLPAVTADFGAKGHIFAGGAGGVTFSDFTTRSLTPQEIAALPVYDSFTDDPSARTWLPAPGSSDTVMEPGLCKLIEPFTATFRPIVCWYSGSTLQASRSLPMGKLDLPGSKWELTTDFQGVPGHDDARDLTLNFTLREGSAPASGVAAAFDFSNWSTNNYTLIPAAVYNGNRLRTSGRGYAAGQAPEDLYRKDLPLTQSDVPRLQMNPAQQPSKLEVNSSNVTTPAICLFDPKAKRGFILLAEQGGRNAAGDFLRKPDGEILDSAFAIEESADRTRATVVVSAPGVRERKPEFLGFSASPDRGISMQAGDVVKLRLRVHSFATPDIPGLLERFMTVRKDLTGPNHPRKLVPASQVETWMTQRIDSRYLQQGDVKFYCPENGPWIAFGWIGGWINTFPMLVLGDDTRLGRVAHTFDYGLKAQFPTGYFSYAIRNDGNTSFRDPGKDMTMTRTSGDILFWMIKQFQILKAQGRGHAIKPDWEAAMKRLADAMIATWQQDGQWGKLINYKTGRVGEYNTTGGAAIIGGLAMASGHFDQPEYLTIAEQAADFYYDRDFLKQGLTTGGCADILQNADSETAAGFMTSLMALHEVTGKKRWLEMSRQLANLVATWTVSHDYELPKHTELGGLGAKLAGVFWASTQNKHGAPGICTSSGDPLFKIYRATGDTRYAELMRDIVAAHGESIRPGGFTNERLTFCDADSRGSRGHHVTGWNETNGALMAREIPGIYLRTDIDRCYVFDAVEAKVLTRDAEGVRMEIHNPTKHDARVSIFAENAAQAARPQGFTAFLKWPKIEVKAGGATQVTARSDGSGQSVRSD